MTRIADFVSRGRLAAGLALALMLLPCAGHAQRVEVVGATPLTADAPRLELGSRMLPGATQRQKSRLIAFGLGYLFPGAGHFYVGDSWRAANILGIVVGGFMLSESSENESAGATAALVSTVVYLWSMVDAPLAANRHNRKVREEFAGMAVKP